jgi:hypothetical protein
MSISFVFTSQEGEINNELKTIGEYGCTNHIEKFQLIYWPKVYRLFLDDYSLHLDDNSSINWAQNLALN